MLRFLKIFIVFFIYFVLLSYSGVKAEIINSIIAVVNNEAITQSELNEILIPIYAQYQSTYTDEELLQKLQEAHDNILYQLIGDKLILQEAKKQEIKVSEEEIEERLKQVKSQFPNNDEFKKILKSQNLTISDLEEKYKEQIMIKNIINKEVRSKIKVTPTEVNKYYEGHLGEFEIPAQVRVQTILIRKSDKQPKGESEPQSIIKKVYNKLKQNADFSKLAREYSQDPSAIDDGDMGYIKKNQMMEKIDEVLFSLEVGETSDVIETKIGYHIFKVTDKKEPSTKSFEEARVNIEDILFQKKAKIRYDQWIANLKENAYISIKIK